MTATRTIRYEVSQGFCCGTGPHVGKYTFSLPTSLMSGLDLCRNCWQKEMRWRDGDNKRLAADRQRPVLPWPEDQPELFDIEENSRG